MIESCIVQNNELLTACTYVRLTRQNSRCMRNAERYLYQHRCCYKMTTFCLGTIMTTGVKEKGTCNNWILCIVRDHSQICIFCVLISTEKLAFHVSET